MSGAAAPRTAPGGPGSGGLTRLTAFYIAKYVSKDSVSLSASLSVLVDVKNHCERWPSRAEDCGTSRRTSLHFGQRVLNTIDIELADTQAASCSLGHYADLSSEIFVWFDPWAVVARARAIAHRISGYDLYTIAGAERYAILRPY